MSTACARLAGSAGDSRQHAAVAGSAGDSWQHAAVAGSGGSSYGDAPHTRRGWPAGLERGPSCEITYNCTLNISAAGKKSFTSSSSREGRERRGVQEEGGCAAEGSAPSRVPLALGRAAAMAHFQCGSKGLVVVCVPGAAQRVRGPGPTQVDENPSVLAPPRACSSKRGRFG